MCHSGVINCSLCDGLQGYIRIKMHTQSVKYIFRGSLEGTQPWIGFYDKFSNGDLYWINDKPVDTSGFSNNPWKSGM